MGCIGSRLNIVRNRSITGSRRSNSRRQNTFPVLNVDDMGRQISPGKLEVTETDLVLHVRGKPSLTWPLRCLRRYGYDNDLFSFESGRRCPTGAGIFAFRCSRAQSLFNLLQSKIQGNPGTTPNTVPSTPITPTNAGSNNPATPVSSTFVYVNLAENSSNRQTTNAPDVTQVSANAQSNQSVPVSLNSIVSGCGSSFPSKQSKLLAENSHPVYMNVENATSGFINYQTQGTTSRFGGTTPSNGPVTRTISSAAYQNSAQKIQGHPNYSYQSGKSNESATKDVSLYTNVICSPSNDRIPHSSLQHSTVNTATTESAEVNYAELDLKTDNCSSSCTNSLFASSSNKGKFSLLNNKENWPSGGDSKYKLKFANSNSRSGSQNPSSLDALARRNLTGVNSLIGSSTSESENNGELGYATIDFDRTAALGVVTRTKISLDFRSSSTDVRNTNARKTRHNSTAL